jgi:hypothetical protein
LLTSACARVRTTGARRILDAWYESLREMWEYRKNGEFPARYSGVGNWVLRQRAELRVWAKNPKYSVLTQDQVDALDAIGVESNGKRERGTAIWNLHYKELQAYHRVQGNSNVPKHYQVIWQK